MGCAAGIGSASRATRSTPRGMMRRPLAAHNAAHARSRAARPPGAALAVTLLAGVLALLLGGESGRSTPGAWPSSSQRSLDPRLATGALNDWAGPGSRRGGGATQADSPSVSSLQAPRWRSRGAASRSSWAPRSSLGTSFTLLGLVALGSAVAYDLWLSRTPASVVPYVVSFGTLPLWIATGLGVPPSRVAGAVPLAALFAAAAHLANTLRDYDSDRATGSRALAQLLGRTATRWIALALGLAVGVGVGVALALGTPHPGGGAERRRRPGGDRCGRDPRGRPWRGQLVAAVAWTAAWALSGRT